MLAFVLSGLLASLAGCLALYLASYHQRLLSAPWPRRPAWAGALALLGAGLVLLAQGMLLLTAVFTFVTAVMFALSVLPYLGALRQIGRKA
jgi:hypothetical protein